MENVISARQYNLPTYGWSFQHPWNKYFADHAKVINGVSNFLTEVFGEKGKHARVSVGASSLALDSSVEVDFIV